MSDTEEDLAAEEKITGPDIHTGQFWIDGRLVAGASSEAGARAVIASLQNQPAPTVDDVRRSMPTLTPRQIRLALQYGGTSPAAVDAVIAAMPEGNAEEINEKNFAQIEWAHAGAFERMHPLVISIGAALDYTPEETDALWLWAANL